MGVDNVKRFLFRHRYCQLSVSLDFLIQIISVIVGDAQIYQLLDASRLELHLMGNLGVLFECLVGLGGLIGSQNGVDLLEPDILEETKGNRIVLGDFPADRGGCQLDVTRILAVYRFGKDKDDVRFHLAHRAGESIACCAKPS